MDELLFNILKVVVAIATLVVTRYLIPYINAKLDTEKLNKVTLWIKEAVLAAEQLFGDGTGEKKKRYVIESVKKICDEIAISLDEKQIELLLESAVKIMNANSDKESYVKLL